jgi:hypothetical protein
MLVGIYPLAFIVGALTSWLMINLNRVRRGWSAQFAGLGILAFTVLDQASYCGSVTKLECRQRIEKLKDVIQRARGRSDRFKALWVNEQTGKYFILEHLDAMLAGQDLGLSVINGYSGLAPRGYPAEMIFLKPDCSVALRTWLRTQPAAFPNDSILEIGPQFAIPDDYMPVPSRGFSDIETLNFIHYWATDPKAEMRLVEKTDPATEYVVTFDLATLNERTVWVASPDKHEQVIHLVPGSRHHVEVRFLPVGMKSKISFRSDAEGIKPKGETRTLFFDVENPTENAVPKEGIGEAPGSRP